MSRGSSISRSSTRSRDTKREGTMTEKPQVTEEVEQIKEQTQQIASSPVVARLARLGYAIKGIIYMLMGALAAPAALGLGHQETDQPRLMRTLWVQPWSRGVLIALVIGVLAYSL